MALVQSWLLLATGKVLGCFCSCDSASGHWLHGVMAHGWDDSVSLVLGLEIW